MLVVRHALEDPVCGGSWRQEEARGQDLIVIHEGVEGLVLDHALAPERAEGWSAVQLVLYGPFVARGTDGSIDLRAGDILVSRTYGDAQLRAMTKRSETLVFCWRSNSFVGDGVDAGGLIRPSAVARSRLVRVIDALAFDDPRAVRQAVFDALDELRAEGLPFDAGARDAMLGGTGDDHEIAHAIEDVVCPLS